MMSIISEQILLYLQDSFLKPCDAYRSVSCIARLLLMGWTTPGAAAHVHYRGYLGLYPPQLVLERLVSAEQRRLEQVRAV